MRCQTWRTPAGSGRPARVWAPAPARWGRPRTLRRALPSAGRAAEARKASDTAWLPGGCQRSSRLRQPSVTGVPAMAWPGGRFHADAGTAGQLTEVGLRVDVHDGWQQVGKRLAGARLGQADQVAPQQRHGPPLRLDGGRLCEARLEHLLQHVRCSTPSPQVRPIRCAVPAAAAAAQRRSVCKPGCEAGPLCMQAHQRLLCARVLWGPGKPSALPATTRRAGTEQAAPGKDASSKVVTGLGTPVPST